MTCVRRNGDWRVVGPLLALILAVFILFGGLNTMFGNAVTCLAFCGVLVIILVREPLPSAFWRSAAPVLSLLAAALIWAWLCGTSAGASLIGGTPATPDLAGSELLGMFGYMAALLCGAAMGYRHWPTASLLDWLVGLGCLTILVALFFRAAGGSPDWPFWGGSRGGRFLGTLANFNVAAATYAVLAALAMARALASGLRQEAPGTTILFAMAALLALGACVLTGSRSGLVLAVAGQGTVVVAALGLPRRTLLRWVPLALAVACLSILALAWSSDLLTERFGRLPGEAESREQMWRHYATVAATSPWTGFGVGAFPDVNTRFLPGIVPAQQLWMVNSPHNIVLRLLIDGGVPFLLLILGAAGLIAYRLIRSGALRDWTLEQIGMAVGVATVVGSAMIDIALEVPATTATAAVFTGMLWGASLRRDVGVARPRLQPPRRELRV